MKTYEECYFIVQDLEIVADFLSNKICKDCVHLQNTQVPSKVISEKGKLFAQVKCVIPLPVWFYTNEDYFNMLTSEEEVLTCPAYVKLP